MKFILLKDTLDESTKRLMNQIVLMIMKLNDLMVTYDIRQVANTIKASSN